MSQIKNSVQTEEVPWTDLAVLICSKCQTLFAPGNLNMTGEVADQLKNQYKKRLKEEGLSEKCRVMVSGCQNVCLDNRQAVTFFPSCGNTNTITMHPDIDSEAVYQLIQEALNK